MAAFTSDGVFSMDGDIAPLREIVALAQKYGGYVFVDDAHATGFVGPTGRGTEEACGLPHGSVTIINSTLGKALGGATGGYSAGTCSRPACRTRYCQQGPSECTRPDNRW